MGCPRQNAVETCRLFPANCDSVHLLVDPIIGKHQHSRDLHCDASGLLARVPAHHGRAGTTGRVVCPVGFTSRQKPHAARYQRFIAPDSPRSKPHSRSIKPSPDAPRERAFTWRNAPPSSHTGLIKTMLIIVTQAFWLIAAGRSCSFATKPGRTNIEVRSSAYPRLGVRRVCNRDVGVRKVHPRRRSVRRGVARSPGMGL